MSKLVALSKERFDGLVALDPYYRGRWAYYQAALRMAALLDPATVLEIGPWRCPLLTGCDTMDTRTAPGCEQPTHTHDAASTPWPVADKAYDAVTALQVWEHLGESQAAAWREVRRVARSAILSVPLCWTKSADASHVGITLARVAEWTGGLAAERAEIVGLNTKHPRLVAAWRFS